jgi:hypothetical protein
MYSTVQRECATLHTAIQDLAKLYREQRSELWDALAGLDAEEEVVSKYLDWLIEQEVTERTEELHQVHQKEIEALKRELSEVKRQASPRIVVASKQMDHRMQNQGRRPSADAEDICNGRESPSRSTRKQVKTEKEQKLWKEDKSIHKHSKESQRSSSPDCGHHEEFPEKLRSDVDVLPKDRNGLRLMRLELRSRLAKRLNGDERPAHATKVGSNPSHVDFDLTTVDKPAKETTPRTVVGTPRSMVDTPREMRKKKEKIMGAQIRSLMRLVAETERENRQLKQLLQAAFAKQNMSLGDFEAAGFKQKELDMTIQLQNLQNDPLLSARSTSSFATSTDLTQSDTTSDDATESDDEAERPPQFPSLKDEEVTVALAARLENAGWTKVCNEHTTDALAASLGSVR